MVKTIYAPTVLGHSTVMLVAIGIHIAIDNIASPGLSADLSNGRASWFESAHARLQTVPNLGVARQSYRGHALANGVIQARTSASHAVRVNEHSTSAWPAKFGDFVDGSCIVRPGN